MIKVNSSQFNYQYGNQIHFPYSIASLVSYANNNNSLKNKFKFEKTFVFRTKVDEYINECKDSEILLCSCYVWNWETTTYLAKEIRKINPTCFIIFGGPQVPDFSSDFFDKYPFVDMLVHGEGEHVLEKILTAYLSDKDYSKILGIQTKDFRTAPHPRIDNLGQLPSPYLTNTVWNLVDKKDDVQWIASWETNRGCPYECTFCDWGSATFTKLRNYEDEKLFNEIEWFADNKIPYIDCCDANFGIYQERDFRIAKKLKEVALEKHYPERIRPAWAKNTTEKIIPIAQELQKGGILGSVTLAVQSLDKETLNIMKRANIKFDKFSELTEEFRRNEIPTYTELIMGLPGETLETYKNGLESIATTKIDTIQIYHCSVLPNAPMNSPEYKEKYKIKTVRSPIFLWHSSIHNRGMPEYEEIVVETSTCPIDELKEVYLYTWSFLGFQAFGLLEHLANFYKQNHGLNYMKFYEMFLDFCRSKESVFSEEFEKVIKFRDDGYSGKGWDHVDPKLGDIIWPIEEASWLRLTYDTQKLSSGLRELVSHIEEKSNSHNSTKLLHDLIKFQIFTLTTRDHLEEIKSEEFEFDWKNYFTNNSPLEQKKISYSYKNLVTERDPILWGFKTVWYGKRSRDYKIYIEKLDEVVLENFSKA